MRVAAWMCALMGLIGAARAAPTVAVLETVAPAGTPPAEAMAWTDVVRAAVRRAAPPDWIVPTRETIEAFLPPGTTLADCDDECEIDTGRRLGAEYVVTARVTADGERRRVTVALHATVSGRVVGQAQHAVDAPALRAGLARAAADAMTEAAPRPSVGSAAITVLQAQPIKWYGQPILKVESSQPLVIHALGKRQGRVPQRIPVQRGGRIRLRAEAPGYRTQVFEVELPPQSGMVQLELQRTAARVRIVAPLVGTRLSVDGVVEPLMPEMLIAPGPHRLEVLHPCMAPVAFDVDAAPDDIITRTITPELRCGRLRFEGQDNAWIRWNGRSRALPFETAVLPDEPIEVVVAANGHTPITRTVRPPPTGLRTERFELEPIWSEVVVDALAWDGSRCPGQLKMDGQVMGPLPWRGRVRGGRRTFSVRCSRRASLSRTVTLTAGENTIGLREAGDTSEAVWRTDGLQSGMLVLRLMSDSRAAGRGRAGIGAVFGIANLDEQALPVLGIDVNVAMGLTTWLELGAGATVGVGPDDCPEPETPPDPDEPEKSCGFGYFSGRLELRAHLDRFLATAGWGLTGTSARVDDDSLQSGPFLGMGFEF